MHYTNRLRYILQHRYYTKVFFLFFILIIIFYIFGIKKESNFSGNEEEIVGIVYKIGNINNGISYYVKTSEDILVYSYSETDLGISIGDKILINGKLERPSSSTIPNVFDYRKYLKNKQIYFIMKADKIVKIENNTNVIYYIKSVVSNRINSLCNKNPYLYNFLLGDSSYMDKEVVDSYRYNGFSHLFSISGMHVSLFASVLLYILKRISYNRYFQYIGVISFLLFYGLLVGFGASVIRSIVLYIVFSIYKLLNIKSDKLNMLLVTLMIVLIINPYYILDMGFQFSYMISFTLIMFSKKISSNKNYILRNLNTSFVSFLVSFPICIYYFYQVNVLSILYNLIFVPFVSLLLFPLCLLSFIFPILIVFVNVLASILEGVSSFLSNIDIGVINFSKPNFVLIVIYYIFIFLFLYDRRNVILFLILLFHKYYIYFTPYYSVVSLDVSQGDSFILTFPYSSSLVMFDTGGIVNSNYSIVNNKTINYLKSIGRNKISYLILSHGDFDHMGEAINLVNNFKVESVIFNNDEFNELETELIKVLENNNIKYYKGLKELDIESDKLYFLNTKKYGNENDNSNVIYFKINNYKFLFMGDAGVEREKDILDKYNLESIDFIKIGHHGSNTSSSEYFIDKIKPKNCLVSVGKNNRYGHPKESVIDILDDYCDIYRTDLNGSIEIKINKNNYKIKTYNP